MKLSADEQVLTGRWLVNGTQIVADAVCERINALAAIHLQELGRDESGWDTQYRDPDDGRLWELTYPESYLHGGGPPRLSVIDTSRARAKFGSVVDL
jgi:immunity protein 27 of polymorphic toxin system